MRCTVEWRGLADLREAHAVGGERGDDGRIGPVVRDSCPGLRRLRRQRAPKPLAFRRGRRRKAAAVPVVPEPSRPCLEHVPGPRASERRSGLEAGTGELGSSLEVGVSFAAAASAAASAAIPAAAAAVAAAAAATATTAAAAAAAAAAASAIVATPATTIFGTHSRELVVDRSSLLLRVFDRRSCRSLRLGLWGLLVRLHEIQLPLWRRFWRSAAAGAAQHGSKFLPGLSSGRESSRGKSSTVCCIWGT